MNVNRLATATILALVCFLLFIYPDPQGNLYTVLRYITFGLLIVILYQFSTSDPDTIEPITKISNPNITPSSREIDVQEDIRDQYEQLLKLVFNMVMPIKETSKPSNSTSLLGNKVNAI